MKQKDADPCEPLSFEICIVELPESWNDEHDRTTTSAVLGLTSQVAPSVNTNPIGGNQRKAYDALVRLYREHVERLKADGREGDVPRVLVDDWRAAAGLERHRWREARDGLVKAGRVRLEQPYVYLEDRTK